MGSDVLTGEVPVALDANEPTYQVRVIDAHPNANKATMRICFDAITIDESSDGVPCEVPHESSLTVAIVLPDLFTGLEIIENLARARRIPLHVIKLRVEEVGLPPAVSVATTRWKRFRKEFPELLREAEPQIFQALGNVQATAVVYRLRAFADMLEMQRAPETEHFVYRLE